MCIKSSRLNYATLTFADSQSNKTAPSGYRLLEEVANSPVPSAHNATYQSGASSCGQTSNVQSCVTDMSYLPNSMNTNDERRPSTGDSDEDLMDVDPMTTLDLIYWAFQIASGMEYLASRNVCVLRNSDLSQQSARTH